MRFYTSVGRIGSNILLRGYEDGKRVKERFPYKPSIWVENKDGTPSEWKSMQDVPLKEIQLDSMQDFYDFEKRYKDVDGFKLYGNSNHIVSFTHKHYPEAIDFDYKQISILFFDIETENVSSDENRGFVKPVEASNEVTLISCYDTKVGDTITFGIVPDIKARDNEKYFYFGSEREMLVSFLGYLKARDFDIISGWNIKLYDIPYLYYRMCKVLGSDMANKLSPWGKTREKMVTISDKEHESIELYGVEVLDALDVFRKFGSQTYGEQESYKLDFIAELVLGEKKLDYSEYPSLKALMLNDPQKYYDYCVHDTRLVYRIEQRTKYIEMLVTVAYRMKVNYREILGTVAAWDSYIYGTLMQRNVVVPLSARGHDAHVEGAWVMPVVPRMNGYVATIDAASLYPNCMRALNISPETLTGQILPGVTVERLCMGDVPEVPEGFAVAGTGQLFDTTRIGIIPEMVGALFRERKVVKGKMLEMKGELDAVEAELRRRGIDV